MQLVSSLICVGEEVLDLDRTVGSLSRQSDSEHIILAFLALSNVPMIF